MFVLSEHQAQKTKLLSQKFQNIARMKHYNQLKTFKDNGHITFFCINPTRQIPQLSLIMKKSNSIIQVGLLKIETRFKSQKYQM